VSYAGAACASNIELIDRSSTASNWLWNCIIAVITPYLVGPDEANLGSRVFFLWGGLCTACMVYAYFLVPETKVRGRSGVSGASQSIADSNSRDSLWNKSTRCSKKPTLVPVPNGGLIIPSLPRWVSPMVRRKSLCRLRTRVPFEAGISGKEGAYSEHTPRTKCVRDRYVLWIAQLHGSIAHVVLYQTAKTYASEAWQRPQLLLTSHGFTFLHPSTVNICRLLLVGVRVSPE